MSTVWVGIDPGKEGAVAVIQGNGVTFVDTPTRPSGKAGSKRRLYDEAGMAQVLRDVQLVAGDAPLRVVLEIFHGMPGQSATSTFSQGLGLGLWQGILAGLQIPYQTVYPQTWKRVVLAGYKAKDKGAAGQVAARIYPQAAAQLCTPRGRFLDGRADALLIAEWGLRQGGQQVQLTA